MKKTTLIVFFLAFVISTKSQPVVCGHSLSLSYELGYSIAPTNDNGCIIAGLTYEYSTSQFEDAYLIKLDSSYNLEWGKTFGNGTESVFHYARQTNDGGYIATGFCQSQTDGRNVLVVKTDSIGSLQWRQVIGDVSYDMGYAVEPTPDGGYVVTGVMKSEDMFLIKLSNQGNIQWVRRVHDSVKRSMGLNLVVGPDSGIVVCGYLSVPADPNGYIVKFNKNGNLLWAKAFGGNGIDLIHNVELSNSGGYIITGYVFDSTLAPGVMIMLAKTDNNGNLIWQKTLGGQYDDRINGLTKTSDGNYCASAYSVVDTNVVNTAHDLLFKFDDQGNILWMKKSDNNASDGFNKLKETSSKQLIQTGGNLSDISIYVNDSLGNSCCYYNYSLPERNIQLSEIYLGSIDSIYKTYNDTITQSTGGAFFYDCYTTGINDSWNLTQDEVKVFPNPTSGTFYIQCNENFIESELEIYNALGEKIYSGKLDRQMRSEINMKHPLAGIYLLKIFNKKTAHIKKFIVD